MYRRLIAIACVFDSQGKNPRCGSWSVRGHVFSNLLNLLGLDCQIRAAVCKTFIAGSIPAVASGAGFREVRAEVSLDRAEVCEPEVCFKSFFLSPFARCVLAGLRRYARAGVTAACASRSKSEGRL